MSYGITRRDSKISNDTRIQYIKVINKVYKVTRIQWLHSYLEANETDLNVDDVEESELWDISYFDDFHIRLCNGSDKAEIIDMARWIREHGLSD